jgi:hypothetical protein
MKCASCQNPAVLLVDLESGRIPLCLDCNLKFQQAEAIQQDQLIRAHNVLARQFDAAGLPGLYPTLPERPVQVLNLGGATLNNIKISNSNVGVVNTGTIGKVDAAVTVMRQAGEADAATAIAKLTEAVLASVDASHEQKRSIVELLSVLSTEATAPKPIRRGAAMRAIAAEVSTLTQGVAALSQLWSQFRPSVMALFT